MLDVIVLYPPAKAYLRAAKPIAANIAQMQAGPLELAVVGTLPAKVTKSCVGQKLTQSGGTLLLTPRTLLERRGERVSPLPHAPDLHFSK
jgi:hypothetical protein